MRHPARRSRRAAALTLPVWLLAGLLPARATAQSQLEAASGTSSIVMRRSFVTVDVNQSKIGLHLYQAPPSGGTHTDLVCGIAVPRIEDHTELTGDVSVAAQTGKRSIIAAGQFIPGGDAAIGAVHYFEHGFRQPASCPAPGGDSTALDLKSRGYDLVFVTVRGSLASRPVADVVPGGAGEMTFLTQTGASLAPVAGYNHAFSESAILGASIDVSRDWASPGEAGAQTACTQTAAGHLADGTPAVIESCEDRYVGPLPDVWSSHLRVDYATKILRNLGGSGPSLGLYGAASATARSTARTSYNFAVGPTVHPPGKPSQILGAMLLELDDATNANKQSPMFGQRVYLRLYAGLPL